MVGKNNIDALNRKSANKVNRYGIRRLSVGVASVAVAGLLFMSDATLVQATEATEGEVSTATVDEEEAPVAEEAPAEEVSVNDKEVEPSNTAEEQPNEDVVADSEAAPSLELSDEVVPATQGEGQEDAPAQPAIATRDATAPEESDVANDARNAVHAFVGVQTGGDLNLKLEGATGQQFKPIEGVRAYFQWFEDGGHASPVYTAVSDANGRLNIGAKPYIAGDGKLIKFDADPTVSGGHEKYRFWVDEATIPEGYQLQYITGEQVVFPDSDLPITQGGSGSDTPRNTHENWKILLMQKPKAEMHREDAKETPVQSKTGGYMTGTVSWDYTSGIGGVQWNKVADHTTPAPGVTVRASYLSDYAMKQIFSAETARLMGVSDASKIRGTGWTSAQEAELQKWVKEQVAKDPTKWIAETVTAKTNAEGKYILQFNGIWGANRNADAAGEYTYKVGDNSSGQVWNKWTQEQIDRLGKVAESANDGSFDRTTTTNNVKHINYDWLFVSTDETDGLRVMTPYNNNYYTSMNSNWGIHSGWSGTGFGVGVTNAVPSILRSDFVLGINNVEFGITNYDSGANTALPGDVAETKTTGLPYSKTSERFRIVWYDQDGKVVKEGKAVQPDGTGQIPSEPFDTTGVTKTTEFTAKLYRVDKNGKDAELIAVDSFTVQISNLVASRYDEYEIKNPNPQKNGVYEAEGLPDGLTIDPANGTISGKPTKAGEYSVKVSTTIQDESGDIKGSRNYTALITDSPLENGEVGVAYNQEVKPQEIEGYVFKNVTSKFIDGKAIEGLTIENNQITGTPTKQVLATQTTDDGAMGPNVEVTYDIYKLNSKGEEILVKKGHVDKVPLSIKDGEAAKYEPEYKEVEGKVGEEATVAAPTFTDRDGKPATPENVTYELGEGAPAGAKVNADGSVTYTPVDADAGKTVEIPVVVKYSDGTTDKVKAPIKVAQKDADNLTPTYADKDGKAGEAVTTDAPTYKDADGKDATAPEGTKYTLGENAPEGATIDENTGEVTYTPKESEAGKPVEIPVVVTYPDKSTDNATAKINVAKLDDIIDRTGDEDKPTPAGYVRVTFKAGDGVNEIANNKVYDVKEGTALTADKYPEVTAKDGYENPVWSTPAGTAITKDNATITATATKTTPAEKDADKYEPEVAKEEVEKGGKVDLTDNVTNLDKLPEGTKVEDVTPEGAIDTNTPGDYTGKIKVTYPDGSSEEKDVPVTVKDTTPAEKDADKYEPTVEKEEVEKGGKVDLTDNVTNLDELPEGTTVKDVTPEGTIDTNTPGDYTGKVEVTYPDGSSEVVDVPVTVKDTTPAPTDADKYEPTVEKEEVEKGGKVDLTDNVTNLDELPEGTTVKDVTPEGTIDTNTPGDYTGKVEVTYPDGSSEVVDVPVTVKDTTPEDKKTSVDTSGKKPVDPTDEKQDTGVVVTNPDKDTEVSAKDEDGKDVPVEIDENGKVIVTPGTDVDGPIDVTITDPDLPGGKVEVEVEVNGHEKDKDDNGSETSEDKKTTVDESGKKPVDPTDEKQDTGVVVTNPDKDTEVSAKDEDGKDVPVEIDENGKVIVTPGTDVDGPIDVTITDPDLPGGKVEVEVEVNGHEKGRDDNGSDKDGKTTVDDSNIKPVDPTDEKQDTGIVVTNPDKDTKVSAKDEDGKDVPVEIDENGKVIVTPGTDVDGPITVVVEDPDLPGGKVEVEVPVNGHEKGRDDNGSDKGTQADQIDPTIPEKTGVKDPNNLTDKEKEEVKDKIIEANKDKFPAGTKVEIGNDGTATITYPDGSQDVIPGSQLVFEKAAGQESGSNDQSQADAATLPQTGENDSTVIFGAAALSILAGLGLVASRRKEEE